MRKSLDWLLRSGLIVPLAGGFVCWISPRADFLTDTSKYPFALLFVLGPLLLLLWIALILAGFYRDSDRRRLSRRAIQIAVAAICLAALPFLQVVRKALAYPYLLDVEGIIYRSSWLLAHGSPIYASIRNPLGGVNALYPPGLYVALGLLLKLFPPGIYLLHALSLSCAVGVAILTWCFIYNRTRYWPAALAASLLPLCTASNTFLIVGRPDTLAWLLCLSAFLVAASAAEHDRESLWLSSAALCALGVLTKQNYIAAPAAIGLFLLVQRRWNAALRFIAAFALPVIAATWLLNRVTHGGYLFATVQTLADARYSWMNFWAITGPFVKAEGLLLLLVFPWMLQQRRRPTIQLLSIYMVLSLLCCVSVAKDGSNTNYLMEISGLLSLALGLFLHALHEQSTEQAAWPIFLLAGIFFMWLPMRNQVRPYSASPLSQQRSINDAMLHLMRRSPAPFLSSDYYLPLLTHRPDASVPMEWFIEGSLKRSQPERREVILRAFASGKYNLALSPDDLEDKEAPGAFFDPPTKAVLQKYYRTMRSSEYQDGEEVLTANFFVLTPCHEDCGFEEPAFPPSASEPGAYRMIYRIGSQWVKGHFHNIPASR